MEKGRERLTFGKIKIKCKPLIKTELVFDNTT